MGEESFELVVKLVFALRNERALVPGALIGTGTSASQPSLEVRAAALDEDDAEYERERARPRKGVVFGRLPPSSSQARSGGRARDDDDEEYSEASDDANGVLCDGPLDANAPSALHSRSASFAF